MSTPSASEIIGKPVHFASGVVAPNSTLKSAMTERLCTWSDNDFSARGWPTPEYINLYKVWGEGGIGTIILGNIPCDARYPEAKKNACMDFKIASKEKYAEAYKPVVAAAKAHGSLVIGQVTHGGRQTSELIAPEPVSSSDVQCKPAMGQTFGKPRPLTVEEIHDVVDRFAFAASVLYASGADGINLHSAHGYLLSQFLSPHVNKRTDAYGGDLTGRSRIVFEIITAIRKLVPDPKFLVTIKMNSADFAEGGFDADDSMEMVKRLEAAGVALVELSGGTYETRGFMHKKESTIKRESFFIEFAERIRPHLTTAKLAVTGGFRSAPAMAQALTERSCDIVGLGRPLCANPYFVKEILEEKTTRAVDWEQSVNGDIQIAAACTALGQIGRTGAKPSDLSTKEGAAEIVALLRAGMAAA